MLCVPLRSPKQHRDGFDSMQTNGDWQGAFPMPIRITSAIGETLEDSITSTLLPHFLGLASVTYLHCTASRPLGKRPLSASLAVRGLWQHKRHG